MSIFMDLFKHSAFTVTLNSQTTLNAPHGQRQNHNHTYLLNMYNYTYTYVYIGRYTKCTSNIYVAAQQWICYHGNRLTWCLWCGAAVWSKQLQPLHPVPSCLRASGPQTSNPDPLVSSVETRKGSSQLRAGWDSWGDGGGRERRIEDSTSFDCQLMFSGIIADGST